MSLFIDIVSLVGSAASISGVSVKDFLSRVSARSSDKVEIENFMLFLEGRNVLFAGMDNEVQAAVIRSLEEIKREAEQLRTRCADEEIKTILLTLLLTMSKELHRLHGVNATSAHGQYKMYLALQGVRFELARILALLCAAFQIDPKNPRMREFILNFAVRPRR